MARAEQSRELSRELLFHCQHGQHVSTLFHLHGALKLPSVMNNLKQLQESISHFPFEVQGPCRPGQGHEDLAITVVTNTCVNCSSIP